jgi:hypothetical protein
VSGAAGSKLTLPCEITGAETKEPFAVGKLSGMARAFAREEGSFSVDGEVFFFIEFLYFFLERS